VVNTRCPICRVETTGQLGWIVNCTPVWLCSHECRIKLQELVKGIEDGYQRSIQNALSIFEYHTTEAYRGREAALAALIKGPQ
jgi:hypothetical protein